MNEFSLGKYPQSSLLVVYSERNDIQLDPEYQRISGIWTKEKRQLLIDSLINGFDVPKLYFHEFVPAKRIRGRAYRYAIIDGKQRLQTIWDFINGDLSLAADFAYLKDDSVKLAGLGYAQIAERYPQLKSRFDATSLDIVTIRTNDIDLIEDMFSRLNEAVPLNAPEKRNAFGGPLPKAIRTVSAHDFLKRHLPFTDNRYRHRDLAAKFLFIEHKSEIVNTKKSDLDEFVLQFKSWRDKNARQASAAAVQRLVATTEQTLDVMSRIFGTADNLLRQVGLVTLYFYLFHYVRKKCVGDVKREMLSEFETKRAENRQRVELRGEHDHSVNLDFLEFDKHSQTPNDAYAIRIRLEILLKFLRSEYSVDFDPTILRQSALRP